FVVKVHHCIVDGIAGIGMLAALLDPSPTPAPVDAAAWRPRPAPTSHELLRDEIVRRLRGTREIGRAVGRVFTDPVAGAAGTGAAARPLSGLVRTPPSTPPPASLPRPPAPPPPPAPGPPPPPR